MVNENEIINKLASGEIKLHEIEKYTKSIPQAVQIRRKFMETISTSKLDNVSHFSLDMEEAMKKNIENPIGAIQILYTPREIVWV